MTEYIFGEIVFIGEGSQISTHMTPSAIVRRIDAKWLIGGDSNTADDIAEQIMTDNHYDAYLCLERYKGRVIMMDEDGNRKFAIPAPQAS
jgi:aspartokinase-like uncharacterized kinase